MGLNVTLLLYALIRAHETDASGSQECRVRGGKIKIRTMDKSHQLPAVNLLTDAFPDAMGILVRSVRKQYIHTYLEEQLSWPPDGLCLVAMYTPDVPDRIPKVPSMVPCPILVGGGGRTKVLPLPCAD